ncbi:formyl transferase [Vibrio sp. SM6]|uniref:Formyl transferase n=1 Tax=Vibrio agarilyticus TaxID=2726741 RepID=A0A7X8TS04_9VIBR|nr:formyltransferase family protein [Vibrio agarilyticus]NLS13561.1 formyl transferase [Vibrio agarilyticus]
MKVGFIGCVDSSRSALQTLLGVDGLTVSAVVTRDQSAVNADFCDLTDLCYENEIPVHLEDPKARAESVAFFTSFDLDVIFCIGWSYLLDESMLALPRIGVIGFHPASLPNNRGRHPIIWALALGLKETASTLFLMDAGADSGPIASQVPVPIEDTDNATSLYEKILAVSTNQIARLGAELVEGTATFVEQEHSQATYWRKRSRKDGMIDFRMSANVIHNLVRALAPPYPGAEFGFGQKYISVQKSRIAVESYPLNIEPGAVLAKTSNALLVKTAGTEAIWLLDIEYGDIAVGDYL